MLLLLTTQFFSNENEINRLCILALLCNFSNLLLGKTLACLRLSAACVCGVFFGGGVLSNLLDLSSSRVWHLYPCKRLTPSEIWNISPSTHFTHTFNFIFLNFPKPLVLYRSPAFRTQTFCMNMLHQQFSSNARRTLSPGFP